VGVEEAEDIEEGEGGKVRERKRKRGRRGRGGGTKGEYIVSFTTNSSAYLYPFVV
jgi:hypothetical protein